VLESFVIQSHKDIRIKFEIEGRRYEAVGFLGKSGALVGGDEMLKRTAVENGGAIGYEDEVFLWKRRARLPQELEPYWLVTNRRHPDFSREVSCFDFNCNMWNCEWRCLDDRWWWNGLCLVVRRCT
jgi:hypothetical protein